MENKTAIKEMNHTKDMMVEIHKIISNSAIPLPLADNAKICLNFCAEMVAEIDRKIQAIHDIEKSEIKSNEVKEKTDAHRYKKKATKKKVTKKKVTKKKVTKKKAKKK